MKSKLIEAFLVLFVEMYALFLSALNRETLFVHYRCEDASHSMPLITVSTRANLWGYYLVSGFENGRMVVTR